MGLNIKHVINSTVAPSFVNNSCLDFCCSDHFTKFHFVERIEETVRIIGSSISFLSIEQLEQLVQHKCIALQSSIHPGLVKNSLFNEKNHH